MLRAVVAPAPIDVDLFLIATPGGVVATAIGLMTAEDPLLYTLLPNVSYELRFSYFDLFQARLPCVRFSVSVAIQPTGVASLCPTTSNVLPTAADVNPPLNASVISYETRNRYRFNRGLSPGAFHIAIPLQVASATLFRARLFYSFAYGDFSLALYRNVALANVSTSWTPQSAGGPTPFATGLNAFNSESLSTVLLSPSTPYVLYLFETLPPQLTSFSTNCRQFAIYTAAVLADSFSSSATCPSVKPPSRLDSPAYMSPLTGSSFVASDVFLFSTPSELMEFTSPPSPAVFPRLRPAPGRRPRRLPLRRHPGPVPRQPAPAPPRVLLRR